MPKVCIITDCSVPEALTPTYAQKLPARLKDIFEEDFLPEEKLKISVLAASSLVPSIEASLACQKEKISSAIFLPQENFEKLESKDGIKTLAQGFDALILIKNKKLPFLAPKVYDFEKQGKFCISFDIEN